jgi:predicted KAP-like P-loop ATPase
MILPDHETKVDLLNNEAIAKTIVDLLRSRPEHPVTVGVHGDWGAGKSSILEMTESSLADCKDVLCLKFNGWRFQGFEDAKIALIEGIVTGLVEKRPALTKVADAAKDAFKRIDWLKVAKHGGGLALTAFTGMPTPDQIGTLIKAAEGVLAHPSELLNRENVTAAVNEVNSVLKPAESKKVPQEVEGFRKAFDKLLTDAGIEQLVVLIDDLDRCLPDTAIETLEAIRLFVFTSRTAFVIAADEAMIEHAVRKHFPDLPGTTGPRDYARNYLEKLIQVPFRIPALGESETRMYVTLLLAGVELAEDDTGYAALIAAAKERLKRPWANVPLDAAAVRAALGDSAVKAQSALTLSDQIGPILATGAKGNPRQIKRFLNTLILRVKIAEARGFGDEIKLPVLAKLMLAERFMPSLFDQIATLAVKNPDGKCKALAGLEKRNPSGANGDSPAKSKAAPASDDADASLGVGDDTDALLTEWRQSDFVHSWAQVLPPVADIDLRPYLFVAKDRKDYFGQISALGHIGALAEKLMEAKIAVQAHERDLRTLAQPEAEALFEEVRSRIMAADSFKTQPAGVAGLVVLVKAQPSLQGRVIQFLQALPASKIGPWAVGGWHSVLKGSAEIAELNRIVVEWSKVSDNPMLKAAAAATHQAGGVAK